MDNQRENKNHDSDSGRNFLKPKDLVNLIGFQNTDKVRSCTDEFEDYIRPEYTSGGHRLYYADSLDVLKRIKQLRQDAGLSVAEVKARLDNEGFVCYVQDDNGVREPAKVTDNANYQLIDAIIKMVKESTVEEQKKSRAAMRDSIREVRETVTQQQEQNEMLLKQQQEIIETQTELIEKLTRQVEDLSSGMEQIKEQTKKKRWFGRRD